LEVKVIELFYMHSSRGAEVAECKTEKWSISSKEIRNEQVYANMRPILLSKTEVSCNYKH